MENHDDNLSAALYNKQQNALKDIPLGLKSIKTYKIPLRPYNITGLKNMRALLKDNNIEIITDTINTSNIHKLNSIIEDLFKSDKKVIFTMGKGGVGKTTIAAAIE